VDERWRRSERNFNPEWVETLAEGLRVGRFTREALQRLAQLGDAAAAEVLGEAFEPLPLYECVHAATKWWPNALLWLACVFEDREGELSAARELLWPHVQGDEPYARQLRALLAWSADPTSPPPAGPAPGTTFERWRVAHEERYPMAPRPPGNPPLDERVQWRQALQARGEQITQALEAAAACCDRLLEHLGGEAEWALTRQKWARERPFHELAKLSAELYQQTPRQERQLRTGNYAARALLASMLAPLALQGEVG
jgi:hypothetical protein